MHAGGPIAIDSSQRMALSYIVMCLLTSWDASKEGKAGERAFEATRSMAKRLYQLELIDKVGEIVTYDDQEHELLEELNDLIINHSRSRMGRIIRPQVIHTDGDVKKVICQALISLEL